MGGEVRVGKPMGWDCWARRRERHVERRAWREGWGGGVGDGEAEVEGMVVMQLVREIGGATRLQGFGE